MSNLPPPPPASNEPTWGGTPPDNGQSEAHGLKQRWQELALWKKVAAIAGGLFILLVIFSAIFTSDEDDDAATTDVSTTTAVAPTTTTAPITTTAAPTTTAVPTTTTPPSTTAPAPKWEDGVPVTEKSVTAMLESDREKASKSLGKDERIRVSVDGGSVSISYDYQNAWNDEDYLRTLSGTTWTDAGVLFPNPEVTSVEVTMLTEVTDRLGNAETEAVANLQFDRSTYDAANWSGVMDRHESNLTYLFCIADTKFVAPILHDAMNKTNCN